MNYEAVYRIAPATPGLLITLINLNFVLKLLFRQYNIEISIWQFITYFLCARAARGIIVIYGTSFGTVLRKFQQGFKQENQIVKSMVYLSDCCVYFLCMEGKHKYKNNTL